MSESQPIVSEVEAEEKARERVFWLVFDAIMIAASIAAFVLNEISATGGKGLITGGHIVGAIGAGVNLIWGVYWFLADLLRWGDAGFPFKKDIDRSNFEYFASSVCLVLSSAALALSAISLAGTKGTAMGKGAIGLDGVLFVSDLVCLFHRRGAAIEAAATSLGEVEKSRDEEAATRSRNDLYLELTALKQNIESTSKQHVDLKDFVAQAAVFMPTQESKLIAVPDGQHQQTLACVLEGIQAISADQDNARAENLPLCQEITSVNKSLADAIEDSKQSQEGRERDRQKHIEEIEKMASELKASEEKIKQLNADHQRKERKSRKSAEEASKQIAKMAAELSLKTEQLATSVQDYETAREELQKVETTITQNNADRESLQSELAMVRKERDQGRLASRTNKKVENDRIQKAMANIQKRLDQKDTELKKLEGEIARLQTSRKSDERTIRELSQDKAAYKDIVQGL